MKNNLITKNKSFCILPWTHVHTTPSGKVMPCCIAVDTKGTFGNTKTERLNEVINSQGMKELRVNMIKGERDSTCKQCHVVEDQGIHSFRQSMNQRYIKNIGESINNTKVDGTITNFKMRYFDIRFSNICNFKCVTCNSEYSTQWEQEDKKFRNSIKIVPKNNHKELIDDILTHIDYIDLAYFAGGEPLITEEHYIILEEFIKRGRQDIILRYNTNLSNLKFKDKDLISLWKHFKRGVELSASIDHYGEKAEYIRHGTDWAVVEDNLRLCRSFNFISTTINTVVSIYNYVTLADFYQYLIDKNLFSNKDLTYSAYNMLAPNHITAQVLSDELKNTGTKKLKKLIKNMALQQWNPGSINQMLNSIKWTNSDSFYKLCKQEFNRYTSELDRIRGTEFLKTFPELAEMIE
jgi:radical SAM protein with 4Fe4S-binding SPASM domain